MGAMSVTKRRKVLFVLAAFIIGGLATGMTYSLVSYFRTSIVSVPSFMSSWSPEKDPDFETEQQLAPISVYFNGGKPAFWDRFVEWHAVEYSDPRFEQVDSWVLKKMFRQGFSNVGSIDISKYGPMDVQKARFLDGKYALVQLRLVENAAKIELPSYFRPRIQLDFSFMGFPFSLVRYDSYRYEMHPPLVKCRW